MTWLITDIIIIGIIDVTHRLYIMCPHAHAALNSFTNKLDRRVNAVNDLAATISSGKLQAKPRIESTLSTSTPPPKAPKWTVNHTYIQTPVSSTPQQDPGPLVTSQINDTPRRLVIEVGNSNARQLIYRSDLLDDLFESDNSD